MGRDDGWVEKVEMMIDEEGGDDGWVEKVEMMGG